MNNHRLLAGVLTAALCSGVVCADVQNQRIISLEELFEIAESNSLQLRPSFTAEEEARQEISVAKNNLLPEIEANLSLSYLGDGFITNRNFSGYQKASIPHFGNGFGVNITQPVYTGGAISSGIKIAELKSTAARYTSELQRDNIRFRLVGFYLDIYKCHNLRIVIESNISQAEKVLEEMRARYNQGTALKNDITRYELLLSNLKLQLIKIDNTLAILNNNLITTAGLPEETIILPDTTILLKSLPQEEEKWWQSQASLNSPALKLAKSGVEISRKAEDLARSERLPKIGINAAWTIDGPILVEVPPINRNLSYWYLGLGVSYNLSSLYKSNRSIAKSKTATKLANEKLDAAKENISMEIKGEFVRYLEAYEELKTQIKSVELADRNYQTTSTRYSADMALITDMLDAANSKLDAEQQLVNARINIIYYYYKLLFISGKI